MNCNCCGLPCVREENEKLHAELAKYHDVPRIEFLSDKLAQKELEAAALREALDRVCRETRGTLRAHELAIRYDSGNSNWRCLEIALETADTALSTNNAGLIGVRVIRATDELMKTIAEFEDYPNAWGEDIQSVEDALTEWNRALGKSND